MKMEIVHVQYEFWTKFQLANDRNIAQVTKY